MGIVSRYLDTALAVLLAAMVYAVSVPITKRWVKERKKMVWHVINTVITFVLMWLIVWILAFNFW